MLRGIINLEEGESVKDYEYTFSTGNTGTATLITDKFNGKLDSMIVECDKSIQLYITLEDMSNIVLFDSMDKIFQGSHYLPLRIQTISNKWEAFTQQSDCWYLNNKLRVEVAGPLDTTITIKFRFCY